MKQILVFLEPESRATWLENAKLGFTSMQVHKESGLIERARNKDTIFKFASCENKEYFNPVAFRDILSIEGITHIWAFGEYSYGPFMYRYFPNMNYAEFKTGNVLNILSTQVNEAEGGYVCDI